MNNNINYSGFQTDEFDSIFHPNDWNTEESDSTILNSDNISSVTTTTTYGNLTEVEGRKLHVRLTKEFLKNIK